jgi:hypothetical protein
MFPITGLIWRWLPQLRFLQFPWRWLGPLGVPFAYFLAAAIARARRRRWWQILVLAAVVGSGLFLVRHAWWETDDLNVLHDAVSSGQGFAGTDEYDPLDDDHYDLPKHAPLVALVAGPNPVSATEVAARIHIERWAPEEKRFEVDVGRPAQIALRLLTYPAWRVEVNEQQVRPSLAQGTAQMIIKIPAGHNRVRVRFVRTLDRTIGLALSAIGCIALLLLGLWGVKTEAVPVGRPDSNA